MSKLSPSSNSIPPKTQKDSNTLDPNSNSNGNVKTPNPSTPAARPYVFVGQSQMIEELANLSRANSNANDAIQQVVVLTGLGGIGKTELAKKMALECTWKDFYKAFWIDAGSLESAQRDLAKWSELVLTSPSLIEDGKVAPAPIPKESTETDKDGKANGQDGSTSMEWASKWEEMLTHLSTQGHKAFFIFDNCTPLSQPEMEDSEPTSTFQIAPFIAFAASLETKPQIMVTSRHKEWNAFLSGINRPISFSVVEMTGLTESDSTELFQRTFDLPPEELAEFTEEISELYNKFGGHTLTTTLSIDWIWAKFQKKSSKVEVQSPGAHIAMIRKCFRKFQALDTKAQLDLRQSKGFFPSYPASPNEVMKSSLDEIPKCWSDSKSKSEAKELEAIYWKFLDLLPLLKPEKLTVGLCCQVMDVEGSSKDGEERAKDKDEKKEKGDQISNESFYEVLRLLGNTILEIDAAEFKKEDCSPDSRLKIKVPKIVLEYLRESHEKKSIGEKILEKLKGLGLGSSN